LRVATYNIHKGVRGLGPGKRLEIHNLSVAIEAFDADIVCLQEVRLFHHREARRFQRTSFGLARGQGRRSSSRRAATRRPTARTPSPATASTATRCSRAGRWGTSATTTRSDHRFEQRGLLHVPVRWGGDDRARGGGALRARARSRVRQVQRLAASARRGGARRRARCSWPATSTTGARSSTSPMARIGLQRAPRARPPQIAGR
jgi:endonuclease/exonuclease/phosphatase family metal-dependent hydrolase